MSGLAVATWIGVGFVVGALCIVFALLVLETWSEVRDRKARARRVEEQPPRVRTIIGGPDNG